MPQLVEAVGVDTGDRVVLQTQPVQFEERIEDVTGKSRQTIVVQVQVVQVTQSLEHVAIDRLDAVRSK